mmetsp:Transcript_14477/g.13990  ORF Transcript_14477/g.13990 Transcript_14477/m.13990 type:complete len:85 (+) Transcript_14477:16-270(+)
MGTNIQQLNTGLMQVEDYNPTQYRIHLNLKGQGSRTQRMRETISVHILQKHENQRRGSIYETGGITTANGVEYERDKTLGNSHK